MPCFKSIIFYQYSPKTKLFLKKKCKIFKRWGRSPQTPVAPAAGGSAPRPQTHSPLTSRFSGYAPATLCTVYNHMGFRSFCFEQFFLHRSVANLMMLNIIDVCLMLNCFLVEKFYLHYALCDFDSILLHCTKLFIRQSIDREQIFDVTFEPPPLKNSAYATGSQSCHHALFIVKSAKLIRFFLITQRDTSDTSCPPTMI